ncbi:MAG: hypothetical protein PHQ17_01850 [Methanobacterium sp.]|nr:hypothetical protein [Methanobacterium sp.]
MKLKISAVVGNGLNGSVPCHSLINFRIFFSYTILMFGVEISR